VADIRILPEHVVNQIAAGEVVERAASVLKELVENSLDAGATNVRIVIKGQGRVLIQVVDNGCGMTRNDLLMAFERHATSKLSSADDLQAIRTLGFRGEALPSIASVSFVETRSRTESEATGTMIRIEGGEFKYIEPVAAARGTSIAVHSLFYNTPARARFLKSSSTELAHLVRVFKQYALAYPRVSWGFTHDEQTQYNLPAGLLEQRLNDFFGTGFAEKTLAVDFEAGGVHITGVVGKRELNKRSRGDQYLYLNQRPIQSALVYSAVKAAMRETLDDGEWPFCVLNLEVDTHEIDVNVHPAKLEVKFANENIVHAAVYRGVRMALPAEITQTPLTHHAPASAPSQEFVFTAVPPQAAAGPAQDIAAAAEPPPMTSARGQHTQILHPEIIQIHHKYLISQISSGLAIIDQHAAHERILFEKAQRSFQEQMFHSQQLLFPILLEMTPEEDATFQELQGDLSGLGFIVRAFGLRAYSIEAVPAGMRYASEAEMIHSMLSEYVEFRRANFTPRDALAASFACRAAIRTGDALAPEEMTALIDELFATQFPLTCPHGRPTVIHLKLTELDRRFKRTE
jgi:DNA mismatch repair protein MutL